MLATMRRGAHRRHARTAQRTLLAAIAALALIAGVFVPSSAFAFWSDSVNPGGAGDASAATVNPGPTPTATVTTQNSITVSWAATTLSTGTAVSGYTVKRYNAAGVAQTVLPGCAGTITVTRCTETAVPDGSWTYTVTPRFATNWVGAESARSAAAIADTVAPSNNISAKSGTTPSKAASNGGRVYYRGASDGSFQLLNNVVDSGSGPASSTTSALGCTSTGWSHTPSSVSTRTSVSPTESAYFSAPFSWTAGTTTNPSVVVTGRDVAGNTTQTTIPFQLDNDGPTGGAISYTDGFTTATTAAVTVQAISDAGAGDTAGGGRWLQESKAPLNDNVCGTFGAFSDTIINPAVAPATQSVSVPSGFCYRFQYRITDNIGNESITTSPSIVKVRNYSGLIAGTSGLQSHWRMADTGTVLDDVGPANDDGTYSGTTTRGTAGAITGDTNTAVTFDGTTGSGIVKRQISDDFSIELWFKSTQGRGTSNNWTDGAGLVDASVAGVADDFGIALMADGRIAAGTGNAATGHPDVSAVSSGGYNDGGWHHVVMTRTHSSGLVQLYVDGALKSTVTSGTQSLAGTLTMRFGALNTASNFLAGSLDEIATYTTVLTPSQVTSHHLYGQPVYGDKTEITTSSGSAFYVDEGAAGNTDPIIYYRGAAPGSLQLLQTIDRTGAAGTPSSSTSALGGTTNGWLHTPSTVSTPAGGPFSSSAFTWAAGTTAQPTVVLTGKDDAGRTRAKTITFRVDDTGPTGGGISYTGGNTSATTVAITVQPISDAGAGDTLGGTRFLQRATAPLTGDVCGTFTAYANHVTNPAIAPATQSVTVQSGSCYSYRYLFTDNLGNETITTTSDVVRVLG